MARPAFFLYSTHRLHHRATNHNLITTIQPFKMRLITAIFASLAIANQVIRLLNAFAACLFILTQCHLRCEATKA